MAKSTPKMQPMPGQKSGAPAPKGGGPDKIPSKSGGGSKMGSGGGKKMGGY